ncbi:RNA-binding region-containing protein 3-like [Salvia splendens]|uniref:RNA-binding region-containing protein 3-like n=2 Tax=Salvia splendens TaxID=180675 RepID=UPI001C269176|nr:RNA-binding region-containing protein 3-like [Salvia splendens]
MAFFAALSILPPLFSTLSTPFKPSSFFLLSIPSSVRSMRSSVVAMAPDEEKMTRRSPLDFPIEWDRPKPGRRPDIFPQFSPMKTPLPPPMPADPPEEDEEDEEEKKEEEEENEEENPDKEDK